VADLEVEAGGEHLWLLPERAVFWPARRALCVADLHWGKAAAFRAQAVPVPGGITRGDLDRLSAVIRRTGAGRLYVLGDLLHAQPGRTPRVLGWVSAWRQRHAGLEITVVRGNHDRHAGDPPAEWAMRLVDEPWLDGPLALRHEPGRTSGAYSLAGHIHPAVRLAGRGRQSLRLPAFVFGPHCATLPAFGGFTGALTVTPAPADRVFVVAGDEVLPVA
jgi:DNA ligase-associated metallophosphoesterase